MRTLIVEDDHGCAIALKKLLPDGEHRIAGTIKEAVSALRNDTFDIVFLDLDLPDSEPTNTIQTISAIKELADGAVVVVATGHPSFLRAVRPYFPEDLILDKPFDRQGVNRIVREASQVKLRRTLIGDVRGRAMMVLGALALRTALMVVAFGLAGCVSHTVIHARTVTVTQDVALEVKGLPLP